MSVQTNLNSISFIMEVVKRERIIYGQVDPRPPFTTSFSSIFFGVSKKQVCFDQKNLSGSKFSHLLTVRAVETLF